MEKSEKREKAREGGERVLILSNKNCRDSMGGKQVLVRPNYLGKVPRQFGRRTREGEPNRGFNFQKGLAALKAGGT